MNLHNNKAGRKVSNASLSTNQYTRCAKNAMHIFVNKYENAVVNCELNLRNLQEMAFIITVPYCTIFPRKS